MRPTLGLQATEVYFRTTTLMGHQHLPPGPSLGETGLGEEVPRSALPVAPFLHQLGISSRQRSVCLAPGLPQDQRSLQGLPEPRPAPQQRTRLRAKVTSFGPLARCPKLSVAARRSHPTPRLSKEKGGRSSASSSQPGPAFPGPEGALPAQGRPRAFHRF